MLTTTSSASLAFLLPSEATMASIATARVASVHAAAASLQRSSLSPSIIADFALSAPLATTRPHTSLSLFDNDVWALDEPRVDRSMVPPEPSSDWTEDEFDTELASSFYSLRRHLGLSTMSTPVKTKPRVVGHRGALYDELENTRGAFTRCAELGCEAVELDVFLLKDGNLIVFHGGGTDENPGDLSDYCLNQDGKSILDLTYEQALQLEFNPDYDEFPCGKEKIQVGRIPTLEEVLLDLKGTSTKVKIELKGEGSVEPTLALVERLGMVDQCEYSCFDLDRIALVRKLRPQQDESGQHIYKTGALFNDVPEDFVEQAMAVGASEIHLRYDTCSVERIDAIHKAGFSSMAWFRGPPGMRSDAKLKFWDVGHEDFVCYQAVMETGVQQLCCNKPAELIAMLQAMGQGPSEYEGELIYLVEVGI